MSRKKILGRRTKTAMSNPPEGKDATTMEQEDALQRSLARVAYSTPVLDPLSGRDRKARRSRFFFQLEPDLKSVEEYRKQQMSAKKLTHIDDEISERLASYTGEASPEIKANLERVREFFLKSVAPLTLAATGGAIQATDIVQRMVDSEVDPAMRGRFEQMVNRAAVYKMALFVMEYFQLPPEHLSGVMGLSSEGSEMKSLRSMIEKLLEKHESLEGAIRRSGRGQDSRAVPKSDRQGR